MKHIYTLVVFLFTALTMNAQELITCAQASSLMPEKANDVTEQEYIVAGYVTKIERNPSPSHVDSKIMQQWFYLDDQNGRAQTIKHIENGQVVIIRNGIRYNTLGAVLR